MRGIALYFLAGILSVLAIDLFAPPVDLGLAAGTGPATAPAMGTPIVDRTHKGDRLVVPASHGKQPAPTTPSVILVGCEPLYSSLVASARAAGPGRCLAEIGYVVGTG